MLESATTPATVKTMTTLFVDDSCDEIVNGDGDTDGLAASIRIRRRWNVSLEALLIEHVMKSSFHTNGRSEHILKSGILRFHNRAVDLHYHDACFTRNGKCSKLDVGVSNIND